MSRPGSWYDDSLPQFATNQQSIRQLPHAPQHYNPGSPGSHSTATFGGPPHVPPPPMASASGSSSAQQPPSSPYRNDPRMHNAYNPSQARRPSTLYASDAPGGGHGPGHLVDDHLGSSGGGPSAGAFNLLARSASLGGARRKDPFGNHIDDVERSLGSSGAADERAGGWPDGGAHGAHASHSHTYPNQPSGSYGAPGSYPRGGGMPGDMYAGGSMQGGVPAGSGAAGGAHDSRAGLMSTAMSSGGDSGRGSEQGGQGGRSSMLPPGGGGGGLSSSSSSQRLASGSMGPPPPPQQQQSSTTYQPQQHYSLGQPPPPSQNPYIPQSSQHHHSPSSGAYQPSPSGSHSPGGPPPSGSASWSTSYSPLPGPQVEMRTSPLPRPPALSQSQSYSAVKQERRASDMNPPPSPSRHQQQQYHQQQSSSSSSQHQPNPYAPHQPPYPPQPSPSSSRQQQQQSYSSSVPPTSTLQYAYGSSPSDSLPAPNTSSTGYQRATPSPTTPGANPHLGGYPMYASQSREMAADPGPPKAKAGFRKIKDITKDVKPVFNRSRSTESPTPLTSLTSLLPQTYSSCNPAFRYEMAHNPRRVLTKPSKGVLNDGHDNEENDYILYVNDWLGTEEGHKYLILDVLGQGTFGQVVKCQNMKTNEVVAVKVIKNKPAYFNQSMMEVAILEELNTKCDPHDTHHILRMRTSFIHCKHLCLVFECLSSNLYELIKQNSFRGLSTQLVKVFTTQLLDTLTVLHEARLIHCDLKPENILLKSLQSPVIKVIDFGSACHEYSTVYTYIQSRFYRSPEVLLGLPYSTAIDMWSLGCIAVELFLGLPLFPGTSEYNQLSRIIDMLGMPPNHLLENGKQVHEFFVSEPNMDPYGRGGRSFRLKSMEQYSKEHNTQEQPSKQYFKATTLPEIIKGYQFAKKGAKQSDIDKEMAIRASFTDFVLGLLNLDPIKRWSPQQAMLHPFITGDKFTGPFDPRRAASGHAQEEPTHAGQQPTTDPKRPYGGLVVSTASRTPRAYQDAATYNQQLAQHQTYTAQQQAAQAAANAYRHPFAPADDGGAAYNQQHQQRAYQSAQAQQQQQLHQQQQSLQQQAQAHQRLSGGSASSGLLPSNYSVRNSTGAILPPPAVAHPSQPPSSAYFPSGGRNRANTIGQMDVVPPQLARIQNLGVEGHPGGRSTLTPVMNRADMEREWERRNAQAATGKRSSVNQTWPQLEFLEGQAESIGWGPSANARYGGSTSNQGGQPFPPPPISVIVDDGGGGGRSRQHMHHRDHSLSRDVSMGPPGGDHRYEPSPPGPSNSGIPQAPPQAYAGNARYQGYQPSSSGYDAYDPNRDGLGTLIQPLIPQQRMSSSSSQPGPGHQYSLSNGGQRNPFGPGGGGGASTSPNSPNAPSFGFGGSPQQQQGLQKKKSAGVLEGWR